MNTYLTTLKIKVDSCDYNKEGWSPTVCMEMLHDRFVFGLLDDTLKERLLCETKLDLAKAVEIAQRQESLKKQIKDMSSKAPINALSKGQRHRHSSRHGTDIHLTCRCCGQQCKQKQCPTYGQICARCKKPNHFARMCKTKHVHTQISEKSRHRYPRKIHVLEELEQDT